MRMHASSSFQLLSEAEDLPHLREIELCANADLVHIENKYGHFESVALQDPPPQMFPSPVTEPLPGA